MEQRLGIYIHVPFCASKCPYCDFYSVRAEAEAMDAYVQAAGECLAVLAGRYPGCAGTLYFGGGTPSLLGAKRLGRLVLLARRLYGLEEAEITVEVNPGAGADAALFRGLREAGVNRLSLGLQSAVDGELRRLGRNHTAEDARDAVRLARKAGFDNLSLDLMLGIPGQTTDTLERSIAFCAALDAEHVSAYLLKVEPGTPLARDSALLYDCADDDGQADLYLRAVERLAGCGYRQYEISNFTRPGRESRHNLLYWDAGEYLGIGPSAHGYAGGRRYSFARGLEEFLAAARESRLPERMLFEDDAEIPAGSFTEYAMLRLRLAEGLVFGEAGLRYPGADLHAIRLRARPLEQAGLLTLTEEAIALTPRGFLLSNAVTGRLLL